MKTNPSYLVMFFVVAAFLLDILDISNYWMALITFLLMGIFDVLYRIKNMLEGA